MGKYKNSRLGVNFSNESLINLSGPLSYGTGNEIFYSNTPSSPGVVEYGRFTYLDEMEYISGISLDGVDTFNRAFYKGTKILFSPADAPDYNEVLSPVNPTTVSGASSNVPASKIIRYDFEGTSLVAGDNINIEIEPSPYTGMDSISYTVQPTDSTITDVLSGIITLLTVNGYTSRYSFYIVGSAGETLEIQGNTAGDNYPIPVFEVNVPENPVLPDQIQGFLVESLSYKEITYDFSSIILGVDNVIRISLEKPDVRGPFTVEYILTKTDVVLDDVLNNIVDMIDGTLLERYNFSVSSGVLTVTGTKLGDDFDSFSSEYIERSEPSVDFNTLGFYWFNQLTDTWEISTDHALESSSIIESVHNIYKFSLLNEKKGFYFKLIFTSDYGLFNSATAIPIHRVNFDFNSINRPEFYFTGYLDESNIPIPTVIPEEVNSFQFAPSFSGDNYNLLYPLIIDHSSSGKDYRKSRIYWRIPYLGMDYKIVDLSEIGVYTFTSEEDWVWAVRAYFLGSDIFKKLNSNAFLEVKLVDEDGVEVVATVDLIIPERSAPRIYESLEVGLDAIEATPGSLSDLSTEFELSKASPDQYMSLIPGDLVTLTQGGTTSTSIVLENSSNKVLFLGQIASFDLGLTVFISKNFELGYDFESSHVIPPLTSSFSPMSSQIVVPVSSFTTKLKKGDFIRLFQRELDVVTVDVSVSSVINIGSAIVVGLSSEGFYLNSGSRLLQRDNIDNYIDSSKAMTFMKLIPNTHYNGLAEDIYLNYTEVVNPFRYVSGVELFGGTLLKSARVIGSDRSSIIHEFSNIYNISSLVDEIRDFSYSLSTDMPINIDKNIYDILYLELVEDVVTTDNGFSQRLVLRKNIKLNSSDVIINVTEETSGNDVTAFLVMSERLDLPTKYVLNNPGERPFSNLMVSDIVGDVPLFDTSVLDDTRFDALGLHLSETGVMCYKDITKLRLPQGQNRLVIWSEEHFPKILDVVISGRDFVLDVELTSRRKVIEQGFNQVVTSLTNNLSDLPNIYSNTNTLVNTTSSLATGMSSVLTSTGLLTSMVQGIDTRVTAIQSVDLPGISSQVTGLSTSMGVVLSDINVIDGKLDTNFTSLVSSVATVDSKVSDVQTVVLPDLSGKITHLQSLVTLGNDSISSLSTDVGANKTEVLTAINSLAQYDARALVTAVDSKVMGVDSKVSNILNTVNLTKAQVTDNEITLNQVLSDCLSISTAVTGVDSKVSSLNTSTNALTNSMNLLATSINTVSNEHTGIQQSLSDITNATNVIIGTQDSHSIILGGLTLGTVESKLDGINILLSTTSSKVMDTNDKITSMVGDISAIDSELSSVSGELSATHSAVGNCNFKLDSQLSLLSNISSNITGISDSTGLNTSSLVVVNSKLDTLQNSQSSMSSDISSISSGITTTVGKVTAVQGTVEDTRTLVDALSVLLTTVNNTLNTFSTVADGKLDGIDLKLDQMPLGAEILEVLAIVSDSQHGNEALSTLISGLLTSGAFNTVMTDLIGTGFNPQEDSISNISTRVAGLLSGQVSPYDIWSYSDRGLTTEVDLIANIKQQLDRIENLIGSEVTFDDLHAPSITSS